MGPEKVRATAVQGWLVVTDKRSDLPGAAPRFHARLDGVQRPHRSAIELDGPVLYRVTAKGMLIRGTECRPGEPACRQTWFCVPRADPGSGAG